MDTRQNQTQQKLARKQMKHQDQIEQLQQHHRKEIIQYKYQLEHLDSRNRELEIKMCQRNNQNAAGNDGRAPHLTETIDFHQ